MPNRRSQGAQPVRATWAILLTLSLGGCTAYQPVAWNGDGSWAQARVAANARAAPPEAAGRSPARAADGRRHVVRPGETLSGVAQRYGTSQAVLARANGVKAPYRLLAGQVLAIPPAATRVAKRRAPAPIVAAKPGAARAVALASAAPPPSRIQVAELAAPTAAPVPASPPRISATELEATRRAAQQPPPPLSGDGFLWPVRGRIVSEFGAKPNGARNDGINIRAAEGTAVVAAENGVVVYAGDEIPGYGRMLLISHADGLTTAYAHNARLLVAVGAVVDRGQQVATVGRTGDVGSPQLHFELRDGKEPIDPMAHLDNARLRVASTH
jgi:murein DD-endopeptidase MepM/ murein hydrolase activator NlpD